MHDALLISLSALPRIQFKIKLLSAIVNFISATENIMEFRNENKFKKIDKLVNNKTVSGVFIKDFKIYVYRICLIKEFFLMN